jgi:hypothetical protein
MLKFFPLLDLPLELRLDIYEVIFTTPTMIQPPVTGHHGDGKPDGFWPTPRVDLLPRPHFTINILLTCHQIHAEAIGVLYGNNTFQLHFPANSIWSHYTCKFLKQIGPSNCALLKSAEIFFNFPHYYDFTFDVTSTPCKFPKRPFSSFTGLQRANVIVATSDAFTEFRIQKGDGGYIKRVVRSLRHYLPEDCSLKWDVTGGHPLLEKALEELYGVGGYKCVETQTKRQMIARMESKRTRFLAAYPPRYCKGIV